MGLDSSITSPSVEMPLEAGGDGADAPFAIVTCMDARIESSGFFELWRSPLHVIRNAGARITSDVLRSLAVSCVMGVRQVVIVHHTQCRMAELSEEEVRRGLPSGAGEDLNLLMIGDQQQDLCRDMLSVMESPLIPADVQVLGMIYDLDSRAVREVTPDGEMKAQHL